MDSLATSYDVYISGPMSGIPDFNRPVFTEAARLIRACSLTAFNPGEIDLNNVRDWKGNMRICIAALVLSKMVVQLAGWEKSKGAMIEYDVARNLQISCVEWEIFRRHLQRIPRHEYGTNLYQI